ncbi:nucleoside deaminase [Streptomyces sp. NPDC057702]|uniref:nucleoside deaminase n=1 Tax=Streptomyces sp. NPDC057702 TaxID=3346221 RepID=UPI00367FEE00
MGERGFLGRAVALSRESLVGGGTPFGAVVVVEGRVVGEGASRVVELVDPTAHAEVLALRGAARELGRHLMEDGVMYSSSEPCPMCLAACYWARVPRVVFGASSRDVALAGFEDLQLYRELALSAPERALRVESADAESGGAAREVLDGWVAGLPSPVVPKL